MLHDGRIRAYANVQSYLRKHVNWGRTLNCILLFAMRGRV